MIRDPSDGTTYELPKPEMSGLPDLDLGIPTSKDETERLDKSR